NEPPADGRVFALRELARAASDPEAQARAIVEHRIPYRVATTVVREPTPVVLRALVETMTPMELINNLGSLKRRGALDDAATKMLIESRLALAHSDNRVSAFKAEVAADAAGVGEELSRTLTDVTEARIKARGRVHRPTALLIDKSGSMSVAIE